eukprot:tig00021070_g17867.t1
MTDNLHIAEVEYNKRLTIFEEEHEEKLLFLLQQIDAANHAARVSGAANHAEKLQYSIRRSRPSWLARRPGGRA